VKY
jgi:hypothetical protein